jgi:hypothetical protein
MPTLYPTPSSIFRCWSILDYVDQELELLAKKEGILLPNLHVGCLDGLFKEAVRLKLATAIPLDYLNDLWARLQLVSHLAPKTVVGGPTSLAHLVRQAQSQGLKITPVGTSPRLAVQVKRAMAWHIALSADDPAVHRICTHLLARLVELRVKRIRQLITECKAHPTSWVILYECLNSDAYDPAGLVYRLFESDELVETFAGRKDRVRSTDERLVELFALIIRTSGTMIRDRENAQEWLSIVRRHPPIPSDG